MPSASATRALKRCIAAVFLAIFYAEERTTARIKSSVNPVRDSAKYTHGFRFADVA
jgi:hypothetical protein